MNKETLLDYSDDELSLHVFNDEGLYLMRGNWFDLKDAISERFVFTDEQLQTLRDDIAADADDE